jgi:hypothetical protein
VARHRNENGQNRATACGSQSIAGECELFFHVLTDIVVTDHADVVDRGGLDDVLIIEASSKSALV